MPGTEGKTLMELRPEDVEKIWLKHYDKGVRAHIDYPEIPLYALLEESAERYPEKPALIFYGKRITYKELNELTDRVASYLYSIGIRKGSKVLIDLPNLPQYVIAYYGILKAGATVVQCNPLYTEREIRYIIENSEAEAAFLLESLFPRFEKILNEGKLKKAVICKVEDYLPFPLNILYPLKKEKVKIPKRSDVAFWKEIEKQKPLRERPNIDPKEDVAVFLYTGGTTGVPKAVMSTHYNLVANTYQVLEWLPDKDPERDTYLGVLPYFHSYGMTTSLNAPIAFGATIVLVPDPRDVKSILKFIQKYKVAIFCGVPTMYAAVLNHPERKKYDLSTVRACISGAAPLPVELKKNFESATGGKLVEGYGLSETSPVTHANPIYGLNKAGSIGIPLPDTLAVVVDEEGRVLPTGQIGELAIYGPQVMKGYWKMESETAKVLVNGWLLTGDMAKMDEDGYFYIVERKKDMIIAGGYNIYPREVEEVLYEHPAVLEAAVIGVPDPYRGETVKAFVVLKPEFRGKVTAEEIIKFCKERLAAYKVPKLIEFRDELPKSAVGKILRRVLKEEEIKKAKT
ncbi:MAG: long-chain acyl-CoA synthetase [Archaeoglobaceae archaeon]|nr:long-chain acyl-CoA synthetase [Archaeoglobaceae archaeon]